MSRCDRCSRAFDHPGLFTVHHDDERNPQWAALFCSEECRDSFIEKYRGRPDVALEVLSLRGGTAMRELTKRQRDEAARLGWSADEYARYLEMDDVQREAFRDAKALSDPTYHESHARRRRRAFRLIRGGAE